MSYRVLIIPEDFVKDEGILTPVIAAMLAAAGKPRAKIEVCHNPRLGGTGQALNKDRIAAVVEMYGMVDLFLLCVDRDGLAGRRERLDNIELHVQELCGKRLLAVNAWQEVEVWALAGLQNLPTSWVWSEVRAEVSVKEMYFLPMAQQEGVDLEPDEGRGALGKRAAANYTRIHQLCPEDIQALQERI
jgi:hypothetical protein